VLSKVFQAHKNKMKKTIENKQRKIKSKGMCVPLSISTP